MHTSTSTIRRAPIVLTVLLPIVMLAMPTIPAWADAADPAPIHMASSVRSFPKHLVPHRSFSEAVSTDVDGSWGGIETLDVPHTESPEEQATRIQAEQARQSEAASRAEPRTPVISAPTTGDKEKPASDTAAALRLLRAPIPRRAIRVRGQYACRLGLQWFHPIRVRAVRHPIAAPVRHAGHGRHARY